MCAWTSCSYTTLPLFSTCSQPMVKWINCSGWRAMFQCTLATSHATSRFTLFAAPHTTFYLVDHSIYSLNEDQTITIFDPNSGSCVTIPTSARGCPRHLIQRASFLTLMI